MQFDHIQFPVMGTVHKIVHFTDEHHQYAFSFASPYIYNEPQSYKEKNAFLLGKFNPFDANPHAPEEVYAWFTLHPEKKVHPDWRKNSSVRVITFFAGDDRKIGSMEVNRPRFHFLSHSVLYPHWIVDAEGKTVGFCHYQPKAHRKCVYALSTHASIPHQPITEERIRQMENMGEVHRLFSYELLQKQTDFRKRMESIFSAEKKSELIQNRISQNQCASESSHQLLSLTALVAFFWDTLIDLPLLDQ